MKSNPDFVTQPTNVANPAHTIMAICRSCIRSAAREPPGGGCNTAGLTRSTRCPDFHKSRLLTCREFLGRSPSYLFRKTCPKLVAADFSVIWGIILRDFWGAILRGAPMRTSAVLAFA